MTNRHDPKHFIPAREVSTTKDGITVKEGIGTGEFAYSATHIDTVFTMHGSSPRQARERMRSFVIRRVR